MAIAYDAPIPATAAWRQGDEPGQRKFVDLRGRLALERGGSLPSVRVAYETWGSLSPARDNAVLVLHALTGDSHVAGTDGPGHPTAGWWDAVVGPGKAIDTDRWFVVAPNVLGGCQGTTGPSSTAPDGKPWGSRFPGITVRDQVSVEAAFAEALDINEWASVVGGSMGGMRALEWAVGRPQQVRSLVLLATGAYATADQIGLQTTQLDAIRMDPKFRNGDYYDAAAGDGPHRGMGLARRIAHLSYRGEVELDYRFGRHPQGQEDPEMGGRYAIQSYLDHHGDKLARRFDANSYVVLTEAMNSHDVGRGRGGLEVALGRVTARTGVVGVDSDRLYPLRLQQELAHGIRGCDALSVISSPFGHDAFLIESEAVGAAIRTVLESVPLAVRAA